MTYTLAIVGSRDFTDRVYFDARMEEYRNTHGTPARIVSGGARGVDSLARRWAQSHGVELVEIVPDWKTHGKAAGVLRNSDIILAADRVLAIHVNGSRGTADSIQKARRRLAADRITVLTPS